MSDTPRMEQCSGKRRELSLAKALHVEIMWAGVVWAYTMPHAIAPMLSTQIQRAILEHPTDFPVMVPLAAATKGSHD